MLGLQTWFVYFLIGTVLMMIIIDFIPNECLKARPAPPVENDDALKSELNKDNNETTNRNNEAERLTLQAYIRVNFNFKNEELKSKKNSTYKKKDKKILMKKRNFSAEQ